MRDIQVADTPAAEVVIPGSGQLALVRQVESRRINVVDLVTAERRSVELPGVVTDLDLSPDAEVGVAVIRGVFDAGGEYEPVAM